MQRKHKDLGDDHRDCFEYLSSSWSSPALMNVRSDWKMKTSKNVFLIVFPKTSFCCPQNNLVLTRLVLLMVSSPRFSQQWCWKCCLWLFVIPAVEMKTVALAQRYSNQVVCKPCQKLQTGDTQARLGGFYKGNMSQGGQGGVFPLHVCWASFLHPCWETISFEKHFWKHSPLIFRPSTEMVSFRKLLSFAQVLFILWIVQENLGKRKGLFSWKVFFALLNHHAIVWTVIVQHRCCLASRLHSQHPQSYGSFLSISQ